jgi:hypothetical protein
MLLNAFAQGVDPGRSLRVIFPLFLCLAGLINVHIAGCAGIRPARIVAPILVAACVNVVWRITHGILFKGVTLETARTEVQSSANNWLAAFIGASLLLRRHLRPSLFVALAILFGGILITVTRSLLFPVLASALATTACLLLGARWKIYRPREIPRRFALSAALSALALAAVALMAVASPQIIERWNERLFHHASDRNLTTDISWLTREAEASAIRSAASPKMISTTEGSFSPMTTSPVSVAASLIARIGASLTISCRVIRSGSTPPASSWAAAVDRSSSPSARCSSLGAA